MKRVLLTCVLLVPAFVIVTAGTAQAYTPVPGPDFDGCGPMPFTPRPFWAFNMDYETELNNPVTWPAPGGYEFCAYSDMIYCSLAALAGMLEEIADFADLVQCRYMDINGPVNMEADIPVSPNGIPDGQYELGVLAYVLNNTGNEYHVAAMTAFQDNFMYLRELVLYALYVNSLKADDKDLRPIVENVMAPHLVSSLLCVLSGFAVLRDEQTNAALDQLLLLLEDIGIAPPPGGIQAVTTGIPELGPYGDADGDGDSNYAEYQYFVGEMGYDATQYVDAVFDPNTKLPVYDPVVNLSATSGSYAVGSTVSLSAKIANYYDVPEYIRWTKDGALLDGSELTLEVLNAQVEDSGVYRIEVGIMVEDGGKALVPGAIADSVNITVSDAPIPVAGVFGLTLLASACALAGVAGIRRRK